MFPIAWSSKLGSVGRDYYYYFFFEPTSMLLKTGSKHRLTVQGNEENSNRKPVFNKSVSIERLSESVNIATVKRLLLKLETETNFRILQIYYFFGIKNVTCRVDRKHTYFFLVLFVTEKTINITQPSKKTLKQSISYDFVAVTLVRITF